MIITLTTIGLLLSMLIVGRINMSIKFGRAIKLLFGKRNDVSNQLYHITQLDNLREPVQKYFNHILKEGQPYISYARIKHHGQFNGNLDKGWMSIKGEQYATTEMPGFIWKGTTTMFVARDMYISDQGRLIVTLLSVFNIVDAKGKVQYDTGELLRWLGESILYLTNLLPSKRLQWHPINSNTAKITFNYKGLSLFFKFTFNNLGEVTENEPNGI